MAEAEHSSSSSSSFSLFRTSISHWEALSREHAALRHEHDNALASASELRERVNQQDEREKQQDQLIAALRSTMQGYVDALAIKAATDEAGHDRGGASDSVRPSDDATLRELQDKQRLAQAEARVAGMEEQLQELQTLRARVVALEGERDTLQQRARDADHRAKEQEAMVQEYGRRSNATREAMGRAAMDHQRKEAESQARLNSLAEKLRQERGRYMQLQRHNQELSFSAAATAGGGGTAASSTSSRGGGSGSGGGGADTAHMPAPPRGRDTGMFRGAPPSSSGPSVIFGSATPTGADPYGLCSASATPAFQGANAWQRGAGGVGSSWSAW